MTLKISTNFSTKAEWDGNWFGLPDAHGMQYCTCEYTDLTTNTPQILRCGVAKWAQFTMEHGTNHPHQATKVVNGCGPYISYTWTDNTSLKHSVLLPYTQYEDNLDLGSEEQVVKLIDDLKFILTQIVGRLNEPLQKLS